MVLLTPKFVFVAILASFTAISLAPSADAAAIAVRRSHQQYLPETPEAWTDSSANPINHPVLPLPARLVSASGKQDASVKYPRENLKVSNVLIALVSNI